jgi:integrase
LAPALGAILRDLIKDRRTGPVFQQRRTLEGFSPPLANYSSRQLAHELTQRAARLALVLPKASQRDVQEAAAKSIWRDLGAVKADWIRKEFMLLMTAIGLPEVTAPKTLRHTFATLLQDGNVDPLIRNELMGHVPGNGLGMTAVYTHTRPETKRRQLLAALKHRSAANLAWRTKDRLPYSGDNA